LKLSNKLHVKITLKSLIVAVIVLAFMLSIASSLYSSYQGNIRLLKEQSLETNRVYAEKLGQMVNIYLDDALKVLEFSAAEVEDHLDDEELIMNVVNRVQEQEETFNSVVIANSEGLMLAGAPAEAGLKGKFIKSTEGLQLINNQEPSITMPYKTSTDRVVITLSYPLFSKDGSYEGLINGTVYLNESNFFETILGDHYYQNGSYVYVVDSDGIVIYHQNEELIGEDISDNEVVKKIMEGKSGAQQVTNSFGVDMLAGYSFVDLSNWGVVAQTPKAVAINSVGKIVMNSFIIQLPLIILSIIIAIFAANRIVRPLEKLAAITVVSVEESEMKKLKETNAWYYEALQIKTALIHSFAFLHSQVNLFMDKSTTDPLTGAMNRRTLDEILQQWTSKKISFSVIMLDLDHFKSINDTYGHAMGDEVLKFFVKIMKEGTREVDICCRYGGEEFVILLPETSIEEAFEMAESLRKTFEKTESPCGRPVTLSAGVASFPDTASRTSDLLDLADHALYEAKNSGRNRVSIASSKS